MLESQLPSHLPCHLGLIAKPSDFLNHFFCHQHKPANTIPEYLGRIDLFETI